MIEFGWVLSKKWLYMFNKFLCNGWFCDELCFIYIPRQCDEITIFYNIIQNRNKFLYTKYEHFRYCEKK